MNNYEKLLKAEIEKVYGENGTVLKGYKKYAKDLLANKRKRQEKPAYQTPEENKLYSLAVVAELSRKGYVTMNYNEVPSEITERDLLYLQSENIIELWRVAAPYQLVFIL